MPPDPSDYLYEVIRECTTDVKEIADRTGLKPENIETVKQHYQSAIISISFARFDAARSVVSVGSLERS